METFIVESSNLPTDFNLIFAGRKFPVSKYKLSLLSPKFRNLIENDSQISSLEIHEKTTTSIFQQFIKAAQGEEFDLTVQNANDLLNLSKSWEIEALSSQIEDFMKSNSIEPKAPEADNIDDLIEILAKNIDKTVRIPSFAYLPLDTINKVLTNENMKCNDNHSLLLFVLKLLDLHGQKATKLALSIDLTKLPANDICQLLDHPNLDKQLFAPKLIPTAKFFVLATSKLEDSFEALETGISNLANPDFALKQYIDKIKQLQANLDECTEQTNAIETELSDEFGIMRAQIADISKKINASKKKQNQDLEEATQSLESINNRLESVKHASKESKRSPARRLSIEEESSTPLVEPHLTPIPRGEDPLDGIILAILAQPSELIVSSSANDHNTPDLVTKRGGFDYWMSPNKAGQYIKFNFGSKQVKVTSYSIKTIKFSEDSIHLQQWVLEGSNDDIEYTILDTRNTKELNESNKIGIFDISDDASAYSYLQIRMTGPNCRGDNTMAINAVEFFGILIEC